MKTYRNFAQIITLKSAAKKDGRKLKPEDLSLLDNASIVFDDEKIIWVGTDSNLPEKYKNLPSTDFSGNILLPEIVDSHTHIVFGGDRASEYSMRLNGADYEEIANAGGGILNTMKGTNNLTRDELFELAKNRIKTISSYGVGTIEIKSGYGLNFEKEYELSHIINDLKVYFKKKIQIKNTFLAAHAIPQHYRDSKEYMDKIVIPLLEKLAKENIIDAIDIFHEKNYFSNNDTERIFKLSKELNISRKSHADEFYDNKGALLAVKHEALSTDHLLCTTEDGIEALANSSTVACLLPGTGFFLGKPQANARAFCDAGVKVAIASDYNPGSCHCDNVLLIAALAAPEYKLNMCELYASITLNASHALGLKDQGAIIEGLKPRFSIFKTDKIDNITYNWGKNFFSTFQG